MSYRIARIGTILTICLSLLSSLPASAATKTWSSGASSASWANSSNWDFLLIPTNGDNLVFGSSSTLSTNNDIGLPLTLTGISITNPGYTIAGNAINISGLIEYNVGTSTISTLSIPLVQSGALNITGDDVAFLYVGDLATSGASPINVAGRVAFEGELGGTADLSVSGANTYAKLAGQFAGPGYSGTVALVGGASLIVQGNYLLGGGGLTAAAGTTLYLAGDAEFSLIGYEYSPVTIVPLTAEVHIGEITAAAKTAGRFTTTDANFGAANLIVDLNGLTAGSGYDQLFAQDGVTLSGTVLSLRKGVGFTPPGGSVFRIIDIDPGSFTGLSGTFSGLPAGSVINVGGVDFEIQYDFYGVSLIVPSVSRTWHGVVGGVTPIWSDVGNWSEEAAPVPGSDLTFPSDALNFSPINDLATGFSLTNILITGAGYTLSGNKVTLSNGISLSGPGAGQATISMPIAFSAPQVVSAEKSLTLSGALQLSSPVTAVGPITISGALSGSASLLCQGNGTVVDVQTTSTGTGTIQAQSTGYLKFAGSHNGPLSVLSDSTMEVTGSASQILVSGQFYVGGKNTDGNATATTITLGSSANVWMDIYGADSHDSLTGNTITLGNAMLTLVSGGVTLPPGVSYTIVNNTSTSPIGGTFKSLPEGSTIEVNGHDLTISYKGGTGNDVVLTSSALCNVTIEAARTVRPNSTGNTASVIDPPEGATYAWSVSNGTITGGQGTTQISWSAGSAGTALLSVALTGPCTGTGSATVSILTAPATVILTSTPSPIILTAGSGAGGATEYALTNIGDTSTSVSLSQTGSFFTQSPGTFTLAPGTSQTIAISVSPQPTAVAQRGASLPSGVGVPSGLSVPVTLLAAAAPSSGAPNVIATIDRVDLSSSREQNPRGSASFKNVGTAIANGVPSSNVPWLVPDPTGIVSIPPGATIPIEFTILRAQRPDRDLPKGSVVGELSFVYARTSAAAREPNDVPSFAATVPVSDTVTPTSGGTGAIPPLAVGEVALLVPGAGNVTGSGGQLFLSNMTLLNKSLFSSIPDAKLYYVPPTGQATVANLDSVNANGSVSLANVVSTVFSKNQEVGTLMIRSTHLDDIVINATILNDNNPKGRFGTALPVLRSDAAVGVGQRLVINGLSRSASSHTNMYVQEMSGTATRATLSFYKENGTSAGPPVLLVVPPFALAKLPFVVPEGAVTVVVSNTAGGRLLSYGTPVDDVVGGGDTWAQADWNRLASVVGSEPVLIPFARSATENQTTYRTDVSVTNTGSTTASAKLRYTAGATVVEKSVNLAPLATAVLNDVVAVFFGVTPPSTGSIVVTPQGSTFAVTSRSYASTQGSLATFGTAVPTVALNSGLITGQSRVIAGLEDSKATTVSAKTPKTSRTDFGLVETKGQAVTVKVSLILNDGRSLAFGGAKGSITISLQPNEFRLVPSVAKAILGDARETQFGDLKDIMVRFDVLSGGGAVVPYVISTDNGSSDSIFRNE